MSPSIALVTGANRGLGFEVARRLAEHGFRVLAGARNPQAVPSGHGLEAMPLDVDEEASIAGAARTVHDRHGRLDLLINNAGILLDDTGGILDLDPDTFLRTMHTNALGPLRIAQAFAPLMGRGGRIVNVSSGGGQLSSPGTWAPAYCISKTALNAVTIQLAEALKPRGIAVNAVCPGWVRTDMGGASAPRSVGEGARSILWLALEAPPSITGGFFRDGRQIPW